jgi:hypothetical protein
VTRYGLLTWGDLFNPRQALALITFVDAVRRAHAQMLALRLPAGVCNGSGDVFGAFAGYAGCVHQFSGTMGKYF